MFGEVACSTPGCCNHESGCVISQIIFELCERAEKERAC